MLAWQAHGPWWPWWPDDTRRARLTRLAIDTGFPLITDGSWHPRLATISLEAGQAWLPIARWARQTGEAADAWFSLRSHRALDAGHPRCPRDADPIDARRPPRPHGAGLPADPRPTWGPHVALLPRRTRQAIEAGFSNADRPWGPCRARRAPIPPWSR